MLILKIIDKPTGDEGHVVFLQLIIFLLQNQLEMAQIGSNIGIKYRSRCNSLIGIGQISLDN